MQEPQDSPFLTERGRMQADGARRADFLREVTRAALSFPYARTFEHGGHRYTYTVSGVEARGVEFLTIFTCAWCDGRTFPVEREVILVNAPITRDPVTFVLQQWDASVLEMADAVTAP